jgi:hypothetical protein
MDIQSILTPVWDYLKNILAYKEDTPLLFTQFYFWAFFALVFALFSLFYKRKQLRTVFLLFASLFFYYKTSGLCLLILLFCITSDYFLAQGIYRSRKQSGKTFLLVVSVSVNMALMAYFKYAYFFTDLVNSLLGTEFVVQDVFAIVGNKLAGNPVFNVDKIVLPVGISFYIFQTLSYTIDVFRGKLKPLNNILDYAFYVSFFPQLVAGPIVRASHFIPQIYRDFRLSRMQFGMAVFWILNGLVKKIVLGDYIAINFIDRVFANPLMFSGFENLSALFGYSLQVYADFSGYTDIAIGVALLMGFYLPKNFNSPYASWCSSYDYDAPINEAGQTTEKFYAVRELLAKYSDKALPKVPKALPMIEIPPFELNQIAPLFQNLPEPILSDQVHSMEFFDQGYGSILYRTTLPAGAAGRKLIVEEAHDWAIVFVDGKRLGTLDRRKAEKILELPATEKEAVLDILVENMGRVNYSKTIHDYKGITQRVSVQEGRKQKELTGFQVYRFPVEDALSGRLQFVERSQDCRMPAYYKGSFNLDKTGDVYIDMQNWSKGLVWINGYAIGRFWEIGPQQTLFVPGCWLNKGQNEIIVLDLQSPLEPVISGITTPILDKLLSDEETLERNKNANPDESGYF